MTWKKFSEPADENQKQNQIKQDFSDRRIQALQDSSQTKTQSLKIKT